jgi:hypothetical protein
MVESKSSRGKDDSNIYIYIYPNPIGVHLDGLDIQQGEIETIYI